MESLEYKTGPIPSQCASTGPNAVGKGDDRCGTLLPI